MQPSTLPTHTANACLTRLLFLGVACAEVYDNVNGTNSIPEYSARLAKNICGEFEKCTYLMIPIPVCVTNSLLLDSKN